MTYNDASELRVGPSALCSQRPIAYHYEQKTENT